MATATEPATEAADDNKRKSLTLQERFDVVDFLVERDTPIVADTKIEAARIISLATGIEVTPPQVDYLVDQLPKLELGRKIQIGGASNHALASKIAELENSIKEHASKVEDYAAHCNQLAQALAALERKVAG